MHKMRAARAILVGAFALLLIAATARPDAWSFAIIVAAYLASATFEADSPSDAIRGGRVVSTADTLLLLICVINPIIGLVVAMSTLALATSADRSDRVGYLCRGLMRLVGLLWLLIPLWAPDLLWPTLVAAIVTREMIRSLPRLVIAHRAKVAAAAEVADLAVALIYVVHDMAAVLLFTFMNLTYGPIGALLAALAPAATWASTPIVARRLERAEITAEAEHEVLRLSARYIEEARHSPIDPSEMDALTGLRNRTAFEKDLLSVEGPTVLLFGDVSGLKAVNDELGHPVGDHLLRLVAETLVIALREGDRAYRYNPAGDEFAMLCPGAPADQAERIRDRLDAAVRRAVAKDEMLSSRAPHLRVSAAHTDETWLAAPNDSSPREQLRALADARLTEAWQRDKILGKVRRE